MENITLRDIAKRVIIERRIESAVYVDEDAMFACDLFIKSRINERTESEWACSLMAVAVVKYHPIQRLHEHPRSIQINEIFAITIITDFLNPKLDKDSSRNQSGIFLREIFRYFTTGNSEPHAIFCMIRCMNQLV